MSEVKELRDKIKKQNTRTKILEDRVARLEKFLKDYEPMLRAIGDLGDIELV